MTLCPALLRKLKQIEVLDSHHPIRLPISICRHILFLPPVTKHKLSPCSHISQDIYVHRRDSVPSHLPKDIKKFSPLPQHQFLPLYRTIPISTQIPHCFFHLKTKKKDTATSFNTGTIPLLPFRAQSCLYLVLLNSLGSETHFNYLLPIKNKVTNGFPMAKLSGQFSGFVFLTPSTIFDTVDHFSLMYFLYPSFKTLTFLYFLLYCSFQPLFVGFSWSPLLSVAELQSSVLCLFFFNCAHLFFGDFFLVISPSRMTSNIISRPMTPIFISLAQNSAPDCRFV